MAWVRIGNIRGPQGPVGPPGPPGPPGAAGEGFIGEFKTCLDIAIPANWLACNGQTVLNAQFTFPLLWAIAPASWKTSAHLVMPNMSARALMGASPTVPAGTLAGANSRTIPLAALPAHNHPMPHTHPMPHSHTIAHTHPITHDHPAFNTSDPLAGHRHDMSQRQNSTPGTSGSVMMASLTGTTIAGFTGFDEDAHVHQANVPNFVGNSGAASVGISGGASAASTSSPSIANTSSTPAAAAMDMTPAYMGVVVIVRAA